MLQDNDSAKDVDIENMKVIDIKKKLKSLGLPTAGNKSELVERLREAMVTEKEADTSNMDSVSLPDSSLSDLSPSKLNDHLLSDTSPPEKAVAIVAQDQMVSSATSPVPLKKRAVLPTDDVEAILPKKRIVLKRNNVPTPIVMPAVKPLIIQGSSKAEKEKGQAFAVEEDEASKSETIKKVVQLTTQAKKGVSDTEKIAIRAKRFNLTAPLTTEAIEVKNTLEPVKKKDIVQWNTKVNAICEFNTPPNVDVLKKRAARFGENTSPFLKKLEEQERFEKRKSKFGQGLGDIKVSSLDEQEKKKMRAERFGNL